MFSPASQKRKSSQTLGYSPMNTLTNSASPMRQRPASAQYVSPSSARSHSLASSLLPGLPSSAQRQPLSKVHAAFAVPQPVSAASSSAASSSSSASSRHTQPSSSPRLTAQPAASGSPLITALSYLSPKLGATASAAAPPAMLAFSLGSSASATVSSPASKVSSAYTSPVPPSPHKTLPTGATANAAASHRSSSVPSPTVSTVPASHSSVPAGGASGAHHRAEGGSGASAIGSPFRATFSNSIASRIASSSSSSSSSALGASSVNASPSRLDTLIQLARVQEGHAAPPSPAAKRPRVGRQLERDEDEHGTHRAADDIPLLSSPSPKAANEQPSAAGGD